MDNSLKTRGLFVAYLLAGITGIIFGFDFGVIGHSVHNISSSMNIKFVFLDDIAIMSAIAGMFLSGFLADKLGRRKIIIYSSLFLFTSTIILMNSYTPECFVVGRILLSISSGALVIVVPVFLTELRVSRARLICFFQLFVTIGLLTSRYYAIVESNRGLLGVFTMPVSLLLLCTVFIKESDLWAEQHSALGKEKFRPSKKHLKFGLFLIGFFIAILAPATGVNILVKFSSKLFVAAGDSTAMAHEMHHTILLINLFTTAFIFVIISSVKRKILLSISTLGCFLSLIVISIFVLFNFEHLYSVAIFVIVLVFFVSFALGIGVCVWLVTAELMPANFRGLGFAICIGINYLINSVMLKVFANSSNETEVGIIFLFCAGVAFIYFILVTFYLPETKGKRLEDI